MANSSCATTTRSFAWICVEFRSHSLCQYVQHHAGVSGSAADSTVIASSLPVNPRLAGKQICQAVQNEAERNDADGVIKEIDGCHVCVFAV